MKDSGLGGLPLPEECAVRLVDLPVTAGGVIAVDETGFVNIYLNARLSREAQLKALRHELRHYYRGDLYSDEDIRTVERKAELPIPPEGLSAAFDPKELRQVGRGLYRPSGESLARASAQLDELRTLLAEACGIFDVVQTPPHQSRDALLGLVNSLDAGDIAFVTWQDAAALHFSREGLYGALYYDADGAPDNAVAVMLSGDARITVDLRRRRGRMEVCGITREVGERLEKLY